MRIALATLVLCAGCLRNTGGPIDPDNPDDLAPCPTDRAHLAVAIRAVDYESTPAVLRMIEGSFEQCRGISLPSADYGDVHTIGGMPDGSEVVGFRSGSFYGGSVVRFDGSEETGRIEDDMLYPIGIAPITFEGQDAIAVTWAAGTPSSSDSGELITVHAHPSLAQLGGWDISYQSIRAAPPLTGQGSRMSVLMNGAGLQEMRADPGASTLATTGELQVSIPFTVGVLRSLDVEGARARVAGDNGVLYYEHEQGGNAFLGPAYCRWPSVFGTLIPTETADYVTALIDTGDPDLTIALVDGILEGRDIHTTHVVTLTHRGECELLFSIPTTHDAVAIAWAGR
jgi:hypothetical protein